MHCARGFGGRTLTLPGEARILRCSSMRGAIFGGIMRLQHAALLGALTAGLVAGSIPAAADQAPDFTLPDLSGNSVKLSATYPNGPVVLSFWATWCVPCPEEMKHLQRLWEKYGEQGLQVLAPSIDGSKTVSKVRPFVMGRRFSFPVLLDTNNDVKRLYRVAVVPTIFLIDTEGNVTYHHVGYRPGDEVELEKEIQKLLGPPKAKGAEEQQAPAASVKESEADAPQSGSGAGSAAGAGSEKND
ncbi:MAG: redoxin domain-containing protein [Candidatus Eisenbacteria bacterium]|nr:redoxin domain-containing protein [Candidatus Eisenbacteria bacterium]